MAVAVAVAGGGRQAEKEAKSNGRADLDPSFFSLSFPLLLPPIPYLLNLTEAHYAPTTLTVISTVPRCPPPASRGGVEVVVFLALLVFICFVSTSR